MKKVYLFFGPQGSGKSTQAQKLAAYLDVPYFNTGEKLRELASQNSPQGMAVAQAMKEGKLVSDDILKELFSSFVAERNLNNGFVADGFPRESAQLQLLEQLATEYDWQIIGIFINIKDETVNERLAHRTITVNGVETRREDDEPAILQKRLAAYRHDTVPIINWLKAHNEVVEIDGEPSIDDVFAAVLQAVSSN